MPLLDKVVDIVDLNICCLKQANQSIRYIYNKMRYSTPAVSRHTQIERLLGQIYATDVRDKLTA